MNVLIVHAHHEPQSFCAAMKNLAIQTLQGQGHAVEISDLYAMHWNPVASDLDFGDRKNPDYLVYALEQRHAYEAHALSLDIQQELDKLLNTDLVIFNFPLYWFSVPAILKGWFDRVLISGVCYGGKRFYDQGGLKGKRALLSVTLGGREHMLSPGGIHGDICEMLKPILRGTLAYTGMTVLPPYIAYHVPYITDLDRQDILNRYEQHLLSLDQAQPLQFISLSDFDEKLYPIKSRDY